MDELKEKFTWDCKEYITSFFGNVGLKKEHLILNTLDKIYTQAQGKFIPGVSFIKEIARICRIIKGDETDYYTLVAIIDMHYNTAE